MFRSIRKYTPLLKRVFVCVLALLLLVPCFAKPVPVKAVSFINPMSSAFMSVFFGSGFVSDSAETLSSLVDYVSDFLASTGMVDEFQALTDLLTLSSTKVSFHLTEDQRTSVQRVFLNAIVNNPVFRSKLQHDAVDLTKEDLKEEEIPIVDAGVEMFVPTESAMQNVMTITQAQILADGFYTGFRSYSADVIFHLNVINNNLMKRLDGLREILGNLRTSLVYRIDHVSDVIVNTRTELKTSISDMTSSLAYRLDGVKSAVLSLRDNLDSVLRDRFDALQKTLDDILRKIPAYVETEVVAKPQIEVQAGAQTIVVSDYATMSQAFSMKFSWIPEIFEFLAELRSRLNPGTPPKVSVKLSSTEGSFNLDDDVVVLDMSWYEPFKPLFDNIISGCLWLCFGWAIYKRIPDILSGVGLTVENATEPRGNVWSERAARAERRSHKGD